MIKKGLGRATKQFFMTTTLHGFKYLFSGFLSDRVCWLSWCVASACCAGALCAVLWARFLQVPALLAVRSAAAAPAPMPSIAICLPPLSAASLLVGQMSQDKDVIRRLSLSFSHILRGKQTNMDNLVLLEKLLSSRNVTVLEALYSSMPPCHEFAKRCNWKKTMVPCRKLFHKELTRFGVCCVLRADKLKLDKAHDSMFLSNSQLGLVLQCKASFFFGCQFLTKYEGQVTVDPATLVPGSEYQAQLTFKLVRGSEAAELVAGSCESDEGYSRTACMNTCMERYCGCSNPLRTIYEDEINVPPPCQLWQMNCLKKTDNCSCNCMPACTAITTDLTLEDSIMKSVLYTLDPLYEGLDVSTATVVKLWVHRAGSRIFTRQPTETWFTLLSSLGGVFNMFLGVGLFSALELLVFLLVRLPAAVRALPEMEAPVTHVQTRH